MLATLQCMVLLPPVGWGIAGQQERSSAGEALRSYLHELLLASGLQHAHQTLIFAPSSPSSLVRSLGTEGRLANPAEEIPGNDNVYE